MDGLQVWFADGLAEGFFVAPRGGTVEGALGARVSGFYPVQADAEVAAERLAAPEVVAEFSIPSGVESRAQRVARWEQFGSCDPRCGQCRTTMYLHPTLSPLAPRHQAGRLCRSGGRPHCTCDGCF